MKIDDQRRLWDKIEEYSAYLVSIETALHDIQNDVWCQKAEVDQGIDQGICRFIIDVKVTVFAYAGQ